MLMRNTEGILLRKVQLFLNTMTKCRLYTTCAMHPECSVYATSDKITINKPQRHAT